MTGHRPFKHLREMISSGRSATNNEATQTMLLRLNQAGIKSQDEPAGMAKANQSLVAINETSGSSNTEPIKE